jgi:SRSO17 transposase
MIQLHKSSNQALAPEYRRTPRSKPGIAIQEIDRLVSGTLFGYILADSGYGFSGPFVN